MLRLEGLSIKEFVSKIIKYVFTDLHMTEYKFDLPKMLSFYFSIFYIQYAFSIALLNH